MAPSTDSATSWPLSYYERWHRYAKEAIGPLAEEAARRLHVADAPYVVVIGDPGRPYGFIEVCADCYGVSFLDERGREHLMYTFEDAGKGRVFLKEATYRDYEGESDAVSKAVIYRFWTNGRVMIERSERPFKQTSVSESRADVSRNWEMKPTFGEYGHLLRKDR